MRLQFAGEDLELLPEKALYWPARKILAFSDVHLGKAESFQAFGIPIPSGPHLEDLERIRGLLRKTQAEEVYILGDLVHNKKSWSPQVQADLQNFFEEHSQIRWTLLLGNHEKGSKSYLEQLPLNLVEGDMMVDPFIFSHGHEEISEQGPDRVRVQGHIHPVVVLREGSIRLRLPCFTLKKNEITLPSFGSLTGGHEVSKQKGQRLLAVTPESVFEVPV